jgi:hypothetical protein
MPPLKKMDSFRLKSTNSVKPKCLPQAHAQALRLCHTALAAMQLV